jgi:ferric-chelate reductase (NADPH)
MSKIKKTLMKFFAPYIEGSNKIIANEQITPHFHLLTIKGKPLTKVKWSAGDKVKLSVGSDETRSYTPLSWDIDNGVMRTLIYMHAKGPGALWARDVKAQTQVMVLGPKSSVKIDPDTKTVIFFGDETTIGLAHALKKNITQTRFHFFFESDVLNESLTVLQKFDLPEASLVTLEKFDVIAEEMKALYLQEQNLKIILSGKQQSIVAVRERLYAMGIPENVISKKVYWGWKDDPNGKLKK